MKRVFQPILLFVVFFLISVFSSSSMFITYACLPPLGCGSATGCGACQQCNIIGSCVINSFGLCTSSAECLAAGGVPGTATTGTAPDFIYDIPVVTDLTQVLAPAAKILYYAALIIGFGIIIIAGYTLMTSEGNPQKVQQGQEQLTAGIVGVLFILLSAAILRVIINGIIGGEVSF